MVCAMLTFLAKAGSLRRWRAGSYIDTLVDYLVQLDGKSVNFGARKSPFSPE